MNERLFGFNSSELKIAVPSSKVLETEMERTFGAFGFHTSFDFSTTTER